MTLLLIAPRQRTRTQPHLCGLADDLHDHVPLPLVLHVPPAEQEGVAQSSGGGVADVVVRAVSAHAVNDGGEDVVSGGLVEVLVVEPARVKDELDV